MIALDTETTGVDLHHAARPFFVTVCFENLSQIFWEWDVNPETREVIPPRQDLEQILALLKPDKDGKAEDLVLQNGCFDAAALNSLDKRFGRLWPWSRVYDTLIAAHLLASNRHKSLDDLAVEYLGFNMNRFENDMEEAVKKCRRYVARHLPSWRIAKHGEPGMPSCPKSKRGKAHRGEEHDASWKYDTWLPRALVKHLWESSKAYETLIRQLKSSENRQLGAPEPATAVEGWEYRPPGTENKDDPGHLWWTVTRTYANADSYITQLLARVMHPEIKRRGLWEIYLERLRVLRVKFLMEDRGVSLSGARLKELEADFTAKSQRFDSVCKRVAKRHGHELVLPKAGVNKNLREFCFDVLKLERLYNPKAKSSEPTLDAKIAIPYYLATLPTISSSRIFIETLSKKRAVDVARTYMTSYQRFWVPTGVYNEKGEQLWYRLYPNLNPTGTDTLRWSCSNPNGQNISKREDFNLRYIFGPEPGREWWSLDAKGIEDRLPAYESQQQELIDIFERANDPPYYGSNHLLRFHTVYPDLWNKALKEAYWEWEDKNQGKKIDESLVGPYCKKKYAATWYQWVKNGGFAVQYGAIDRAGGQGTADRAFHKPGAHSLLKTRFSKLEALNQYWIRFADKHGYVETIPDRSICRERGYPILCTRTEYGTILPTVPLNYHIQSSAMWWTMRAMTRVQSFLDDLNCGKLFLGQRWPGGYYLTLQVHDELVLDFPSGKGRGANAWDYNLPVARRVQQLMEQGGVDFGIPTPTGCEYHEVSWSKGVSL